MNNYRSNRLRFIYNTDNVYTATLEEEIVSKQVCLYVRHSLL